MVVILHFAALPLEQRVEGGVEGDEEEVVLDLDDFNLDDVTPFGSSSFRLVVQVDELRLDCLLDELFDGLELWHAGALVERILEQRFGES